MPHQQRKARQTAPRQRLARPLPPALQHRVREDRIARLHLLVLALRPVERPVLVLHLDIVVEALARPLARGVGHVLEVVRRREEPLAARVDGGGFFVGIGRERGEVGGQDAEAEAFVGVFEDSGVRVRNG